MCNFIIRPVDAYATVDFQSSDGSIELEAGQKVKVKHITSRMSTSNWVIVEAENVAKEKSW